MADVGRIPAAAVMAVIALGVLEPANIAVLVEMRKREPDGAVIALLMRRFLYTGRD